MVNTGLVYRKVSVIQVNGYINFQEFLLLLVLGVSPSDMHISVSLPLS